MNTNGEFIRNHHEYLDNFQQIVYHCSQNLDVDDEIIAVDGVDTRYMLVVNDDNFGKLEAFLESHPNIRFDIV